MPAKICIVRGTDMQGPVQGLLPRCTFFIPFIPYYKCRSDLDLRHRESFTDHQVYPFSLELRLKGVWGEGGLAGLVLGVGETESGSQGAAHQAAANKQGNMDYSRYKMSRTTIVGKWGKLVIVSQIFVQEIKQMHESFI